MEKNTVNALKYRVFQIDPRNTRSLKIATKLSSPANFIGLKPSQSAKLSISEKATGIITKIKNPMKFGSMKDSPTSVFLRFRDIFFLLLPDAAIVIPHFPF